MIKYSGLGKDKGRHGAGTAQIGYLFTKHLETLLELELEKKVHSGKGHSWGQSNLASLISGKPLPGAKSFWHTASS